MFVFAVMFCASTMAEIDKGPEKIMIDAGPKGAVSFPHRQHQETEGITCKTCHKLFPQKAGSIDLLLKEGTLAPRQVMNDLCIKCHRERAAAGKPAGPRMCRKCHGDRG